MIIILMVRAVESFLSRVESGWKISSLLFSQNQKYFEAVRASLSGACNCVAGDSSGLRLDPRFFFVSLSLLSMTCEKKKLFEQLKLSYDEHILFTCLSST